MVNIFKKIFVIIVAVFVLAGCSNKLHFLVCPSEYASKMKAERDSWKQREVTLKLDYCVVIVKKNAAGKIVPVQHYLPQSDDVSVENPEDVSFDKPFLIGTIITVKPDKDLGIAIQKKQDKLWRVYWVPDKDFEVATIPRTFGVIFLPPYERLPIIK